MLIIVGSIGTMVSLASMASFGSLASERSHYSLVRRGCLSKGNWVKKKRWHCVSLPVCKYSATTATDLVSEQSNTYRGGKSDDSDVGFLRKPTPKPVLMSSGSTWEPSRINGVSGDGDGKLGVVEERNKVIESLGEVLEKAEKLETSRVSKPGSRRESRVVEVTQIVFRRRQQLGILKL